MKIQLGNSASAEIDQAYGLVIVSTHPHNGRALISILTKAQARALFGALREFDNAGELED